MNEQNGRVLLVDDYPDALETWRLYLELAGFDVVTATDGRMAVEVAHATHPDVIVMDLELPVLSGFDATRELKDDEDMARIPVIAATGYSHFNGLDHSRLGVFDLVVVKPCDPAQLLTHIRRLLAQSTDARDSDDMDGEQSSTQNGQPSASPHEAPSARHARGTEME